MATWANGSRALAICDVCGFQYKLGQLRLLVVNTRVTSTKACPACWVPDQPQLQLGRFPVYDPQAIQDPRPDNAMRVSRVFQYSWNPVGGGQATSDTPNDLTVSCAVNSVSVG